MERTTKRRIPEIPFWEKYLLTIAEACAYFNIGEKKLRGMVEANPIADFILWNGNRIMIKKERFEQYLCYKKNV